MTDCNYMTKIKSLIFISQVHLTEPMDNNNITILKRNSESVS